MAITGSGVIVGVLINVLTTPLLSRVFTPEAYGVAGFYTQSVQYLLLFSGLMLPSAVVVVRRPGVLYRLLSGLKVLWGIGFLGTLMVTLFLGVQIQVLLNDTSDGWWLVILAFGLLSGQVVDLISALNIRAGQFAINVKASLSSSIFSRGGSLLVGWLFMGHYLALIIPGVLSVFPVLYHQNRRELARIWQIRAKWQSLRSTLVELVNYPRYVLPANILSVAALSTPFFLIGIFYSPLEAGLFLFAENILLIPFRLVNKAVRPVYLQAIAKSFHEDYPEYFRLTLQTNRALFGVSLPAIVTLVVFGPEVFSWVFGENWYEAGRMAQYMGIFVLFRISSSPLAAIYRVAEQEREALLTQLVLFVLRMVPLGIGLSYFSLYKGILFFSIGSLLGYWFQFYQVCKVGRLPFWKTIIWQSCIFGGSVGLLLFIKNLW